MWYDERERTAASCQPSSPSTPCYRMWARRSTDNGATWLADNAFSDVVTPLPLQPDPGIQAVYAGDYDYATSSSNQHLHAWVDGRVAIGGSSQQDAFHDRQSASVTSPTPTPTRCDCDSDCNTNIDAHCNCNRNRHCHRDRDRHCHRDTDGDCNGDGSSEPNAHSHSHSHSYGDRDTDGDCNCYGHGNCAS